MIGTTPAPTVDALTAADWPAVSAIYAEGIATGNATFEATLPSWDEWAGAHIARHRLVGRVGREVAGWAALSPVSTRPVYAGVAEESVYVGRRFRGQGVGRALLTELIEQSEADGIWTLEAGVFPENLASLRLHLSCGFRVVGVRERIGKHRGVWRDVVFLERRSKEIA